MRRLYVSLAVLCLSQPAWAQAQDPRLGPRVDAATLAAVQPVLDAAARDSLPMGALASKVLEGVAKHVAPEQLGRALAALAEEFRGARAALRAGLPDAPMRDGEVVAAAMATRQGIDMDVVRSLWSSRPDGGSLEVPVTVLGELVRRGVPVDVAAEVMGHVVRTAVPLAVAAQIPGKVDGAVGAGSTPAAALVAALRSLNIPNPRGRGPRE